MGHLIEILKPGRYIGVGGKEVEFSADDLRQIAETYDPKLHEAPLVLGHPKLDSPAYGWIKGVKVLDGSLCALADDLGEGVAEAMRTNFKKRSLAVWGPTHKKNPTPGKWHLRHVGLLGGTPPAVKGLKPVEEVAAFAEGEEEEDNDKLAAIEFGDWDDRMIARAFRSIREFFIAEFGQEKADKALPPWSIDEIQESAAREDEPATAFAEGEDDSTALPGGDAADVAAEELPPNEQPTRAENVKPAPPVTTDDTSVGGESEDLAARRAELDEREANLKAREALLEKKRSEQRSVEFADFCQGIVRSGRPLPCEVETIVSLMHRLDGSTDDELIAFAEGDERSALEVFQEEILKKLPKTVEFAELSGGDGGEPVGDEDLADEIRKVQAEHEARGTFITSADALAKIKREN